MSAEVDATTAQTDTALAGLSETVLAERAARVTEVNTMGEEIARVQQQAGVEIDRVRTETAAQIAAKDQAIADLKRQLADFTHYTRIGTSNPQKLQTAELKAKVEADRIFLSPGQRPTTISLDGTPPGAMIILSRKDQGPWFYDLCKWVRDNHDGPFRAVVGIHEPENDPISVETYLGWCATDADAIKSLGITTAQVLMGGTISTADPKGYQKWLSSHAEEMWFDVYHGGPGKPPKQYNPPEVWLKRYFDAQEDFAKPMGFAEFASAPMSNDTNDAGLLSWMKDNAAFCREQTSLTAAVWFNSLSGPGLLKTEARAHAWLD